MGKRRQQTIVSHTVKRHCNQPIETPTPAKEESVIDPPRAKRGLFQSPTPKSASAYKPINHNDTNITAAVTSPFEAPQEDEFAPWQEGHPGLETNAPGAANVVGGSDGGSDGTSSSSADENIPPPSRPSTRSRLESTEQQPQEEEEQQQQHTEQQPPFLNTSSLDTNRPNGLPPLPPTTDLPIITSTSTPAAGVIFDDKKDSDDDEEGRPTWFSPIRTNVRGLPSPSSYQTPPSKSLLTSMPSFSEWVSPIPSTRVNEGGGDGDDGGLQQNQQQQQQQEEEKKKKKRVSRNLLASPQPSAIEAVKTRGARIDGDLLDMSDIAACVLYDPATAEEGPKSPVERVLAKYQQR